MKAGVLLRYARRQAQLSQSRLAELAGVPQPAIARIETGRTNPRVDTLERLLRAAGWELDIRPAAGVGVDRTAIRALLELSPAERARMAVQEARNVASLPDRSPG